jgi:molybdopterin-guanine dinucleotide biosynthesis protein A
MNKTNITGIILAGGKSSRMGSDKGSLILNGMSFLSLIIDVMKPLVNDIIIVSNNTEYDQYGYKRVDDIIENAGPVAGLYSGLFHSITKHNLVLSCDVPLIKTAILNKLIENFDDKFDIVQIQSQNKTMPLIALYKKQCLNTFLRLLQNDERRLRFAVKQLKTKTIILDAELDEFVYNINTTEQLNTIKNAVEY